MQSFGKFATSIDIEYVKEHYIYINEKDENKEDIKISATDLENMLKKKRKTVAGTIFLYNPTISPVGFNNDSSLQEQGYEFNEQFDEINFTPMLNLFSSAIRDGYRGKLIEIKYLFNLNKADIEPTYVLEEFNADLDRYHSQQLTRYDKTLNYQDYHNIRLSGKFVYFASTHKHDRSHKEIIKYAQNIAAQAVKIGKDVSFTHDNNYDPEECIEMAYFLSPLAQGKMKDIRINAFKNAFKTNPPTIQKI